MMETRDDPEVFMQWKNVGPLCFDFQCTCSNPDDAFEFHLDGVLVGDLFRCPRCQTVWKLGSPGVSEMTSDDYWADRASDAPFVTAD